MIYKPESAAKRGERHCLKTQSVSEWIPAPYLTARSPGKQHKKSPEELSLSRAILVHSPSRWL
jgi:hypothetical protein